MLFFNPQPYPQKQWITRKIMKEIMLRLPWPPSVNRLWRMGKGNWYSTKIYSDYKELIRYVIFKAKSPKFNDYDVLRLTLLLTPPDKRKRDIDGCLKATLDSLQDALVYKDDNQIKSLHVEMMPKDPKGEGWAEVTISVIATEDYKHV